MSAPISCGAPAGEEAALMRALYSAKSIPHPGCFASDPLPHGRGLGARHRPAMQVGQALVLSKSLFVSLALGEGSGTPGRQLNFKRMPVSRRPARRFLSAPTPRFGFAHHPRAHRLQDHRIALTAERQSPVVVQDGRALGTPASSHRRRIRPASARPPGAVTRVKPRPQAPILPRFKTPPDAPLVDRTPSL